PHPPHYSPIPYTTLFRSTTHNQKRFPLIDCNYHSTTLSGYHGRCAKAAVPSFRDISRQYFQKEARHDFVGEAILFAILLITAAVDRKSTRLNSSHQIISY